MSLFNVVTIVSLVLPLIPFSDLLSLVFYHKDLIFDLAASIYLSRYQLILAFPCIFFTTFYLRSHVDVFSYYRISSKERPGRSFKNQLARGGAQSRGALIRGGRSFKIPSFLGALILFCRHLNTIEIPQ